MISHGRGIYLFDENGRKYIDGSSGAIVANIGHGVDEIANAAYDQIQEVSYTFRTQFENRPAIDLANKILRYAPDKHSAVFLSSGSEATESCFRFIIQYWKGLGKPSKKTVLSRFVSYHGNTLAALSLSSDSRRESMKGFTVTSPTVPACYCERCPFKKTPDSCNIECAQALDESITELGADNVAAFWVEPIVGATGGAIVPHNKYFSAIRAICDKHDVLLVADEVITGFGRTGKWFGLEHWNINSDITILGKGINCGYTPLSAILFSEPVTNNYCDNNVSLDIGHTHSANPLSCKIALSVLEYIEKNDLINNARLMGDYLLTRLSVLKKDFTFIKDIRGIGLLTGIEFFDGDEGNQVNSETSYTDLIVNECFNKGLIVYPCRG